MRVTGGCRGNERNAGKHAERETRGGSVVKKEKKKKRKKVNKPGPGFLPILLWLPLLSRRGERGRHESRRGRLKPSRDFKSRHVADEWPDETPRDFARQSLGKSGDPAALIHPSSSLPRHPSLFRPITFLPSLYIPSVSRPRGRDV